MVYITHRNMEERYDKKFIKYICAFGWNTEEVFNRRLIHKTLFVAFIF